jgi:sulfane dehydrogenase subunit SoxC
MRVTGVKAAVELSDTELFTTEELQLAARNHGMPLEALRYPITPVGLHYLLIHYDIPVVDAESFRLRIDGAVEHPSEFSLADLRERPKRTEVVTFECAGNGRARLHSRPVSQPWLEEAVGSGKWTGTPLRPLLEEAGLRADSVDIVFAGLDHGVEGGVEQDFARSLSVAEAFDDTVLLVYELNGQPLPPQHGFPLRLVVPGWYGMANVKWLASITVTTSPFTGYQQEIGYRMRTTPGEAGIPVTRMAPRALMVPPGTPEFLSRRRIVSDGPCLIEGRAWSGRGDVTRVEVSVDAGRTWSDAELGKQPSAHAWWPWRFAWTAEFEGEHELCCRATDSSGAQQPIDGRWNVGGYANNAIQRVPVTVVQNTGGQVVRSAGR